MPTYEYRCKACGHHLEVVQAFTDDALTTCPSCEATELRKVFGSVGIAFKGSGFYKNDSRGKSSSSASSSSSSSTTGGSSDTSSSGGSSNGSSSGSSDTSSSTPTPSTTSDAKSA